MAVAASILALGAAGCHGGGSDNPPTPVAGHPRLFITEKDVTRLRGWARPDNPFYAQGLAKVAADFKDLMDSGQVPTATDCADSSGFLICELFIENFALMSLVAPDPKDRDDYAQRAKTLLMNIIDTSLNGPSPGDPNPILAPDFSTHDRSRNGGRAFGLGVDWLYPYLSSDDKQKIRQVFLRWADEDVHAAITTDNHPEPVGVFNDPVLLQDRGAVRFAGNNYFCGHGRNLGMMAMALDPEDDPDGKLHAYLDNSTGAFLYMTDDLLRTDAAGGLLPEGYEYSPLTMSYIMDLLLALHSAGQDDPQKRGQQVSVAKNPFWHDAVKAYMHTSAPGLHQNPFPGAFHDFPSYGDLDVYTPYSGVLNDPIEAFGALGAVARDTGDTDLYDTIRWIEWNMPPGGADLDAVVSRIGSHFASRNTLDYFLLMDPDADMGKDPRPSLGTDYYAPGLRFFLARTGWDQNDAYFSYQLTWTGIDHRHGDGNHFGLYRKGEWMTKERAGYGLYVSALHNTLSIQNDQPKHVGDDYFDPLWKSGSIWTYRAAGDGKVVAKSVTPDYAYVLGDATDLYNSTSENATDVTVASRSIVWLKPDHAIVYDRAATGKTGRFKRFYLQLPAEPQIQGQQAHSVTAGKQEVYLTSLLPAGATIVSDPSTDKPSQGEPMNARVYVESMDQSARFLHVIQGADSGLPADPATAIASTAGTPFAGAFVKGTAVMFPVDTSAAFTSVTFVVPAAASNKFIVTGLMPGGTYDVSMQPGNATISITVTPGSGKTADEGGVLAF
jgi:hypothetical protein